MPIYDGPERRSDYLHLEQALEQVERLHGAVTTLANAATLMAPKQELEDLRLEVRRDYLTKIYFMAGFSVCIVIILMVFNSYKFNNLNSNAKHSHAVIACLLGQPEASRTGSLAATVLVTCDQTARP